MPFVPFHDYFPEHFPEHFPELAKRETRSLTVLEATAGDLPTRPDSTGSWRCSRGSKEKNPLVTQQRECANCGKALVRRSGEISVGVGAAGIERINSFATYTYCSECEEFFCLQCAFDASEERRVRYHCCPDCGKKVPDDYPF